MKLVLLCLVALVPLALGVPMAIKKDATSMITDVGSVICAGGQSECPSGTTCCKLASGQWGCCPLPNAVCCSDGEHCCPNGYTCDTGAGTCNKGEDVSAWFQKSPASKVNVTDVVCPDGSSCPSGNTCCELASGEYGCCPLPEAVCCSDHTHCCPNGYTCDTGAGTCNKGEDVSAWFEKSPASKVKVNVKDVVCPDGSSCPSGNTCCELASGEYGCCPLPEAVCCSDHTHCCPNGYTCDTGAGTCTRGTQVLAWFVKSPASKVESKDVVCPDGKSSCPDGNTCCELASGEYGCCPLPQAVCCSDHVHCCPNGYTCDTGAGTCNKGEETMSWFEKSAASSLEAESVVCPGGRDQCPDGNTCCLLATGKYGCCPSPNAVCCSDGVHCCPHGYECTSSGTCARSGDVAALQLLLNPEPTGREESQDVKDDVDVRHLLFEPEQRRTGSVICPDKQSQCPDGNTCCLLVTGQYGCCPLPQAVCCADQLHCCPNGYTCDPTSAACTKGLDRLPWLAKQPSTPLDTSEVAPKASKDPLLCPDQESSCPAQSTCCQTPGGIYGCCPYPGAICCPDLIHCCPHGYECHGDTGTCSKDDHIMPWASKGPFN